MKLKTLYRKDALGNVNYVTLSTKKVAKSTHCEMITQTGNVDKEKTDKSHKTSKIVITTGKNIGKANETTAIQQAEKELISKHNKLKNEGYCEDLKLVRLTKYNTFADKSPMPMLLNKYSDKKTFKTCYAQRKYDGVRCIGEVHNGEYRLKSREGKIFNIQQVLFSYTTLYNNYIEVVTDGELYKHNKDLHDIISAVKNDDPNQELVYVIYDVLIPNLTFEQRRNMLLHIKAANLPNIIVDEGKLIESEEELDQFHTESIALNYEGSIVCDPNGVYQFGFRTSDKSKIKPRETEEFKCIGHYYNRGKMSEQSTLICVTTEGKEFHVKLKGTDEERKRWAAEFDTLFKDKPVTVEYRKKSKNGVPMEPVGLGVRDYE